MLKTERSRILLSLGSLYVIWGSTFLGIRIALEGFPPLLLAGLAARVAMADGVVLTLEQQLACDYAEAEVNKIGEAFAQMSAGGSHAG